VILRATGLDDYEVPASSIFIRLRDVRGSYVQVTIPDPTAYTTEILSRTHGRMVIYAGELMRDGTRHLEEIIYANVQRVYFDVGARNMLTLVGTRYITHGAGADMTAAGVWEVARDDNGRYRTRAAPDFFLKPGDRVTAEGHVFTADLISWTITPTDAHIEIEGAA
jgi:hypothetical protein